MLKAPGVADITDLSVIPYGNARKDASGVTQCQHGKNECIANIIESCAIAHSSSTEQWFGFLNCFEGAYQNDWRLTGAGTKKMEAGADTCAKKMNIDGLDTCYTGPEGIKLRDVAANATSSLQPPHQYTPWVVVNDVPLDMSKANDTSLLLQICADYTGTPPAGCSPSYIASLTNKYVKATKWIWNDPAELC